MPSRPRTSSFSKQAALFAEKVRAARKAKDWSQLDLAAESGISYRQVQNIEGNRNNARPSADSPQPTNPKLDTIYLLATTLEVDPGYLIDHSRGVESGQTS